VPLPGLIWTSSGAVYSTVYHAAWTAIHSEAGHNHFNIPHPAVRGWKGFGRQIMDLHTLLRAGRDALNGGKVGFWQAGSVNCLDCWAPCMQGRSPYRHCRFRCFECCRCDLRAFVLPLLSTFQLPPQQHNQKVSQAITILFAATSSNPQSAQAFFLLGLALGQQVCRLHGGGVLCMQCVKYKHPSPQSTPQTRRAPMTQQRSAS